MRYLIWRYPLAIIVLALAISFIVYLCGGL